MGSSGSLLAGAAVLFVLGSAIVAFRGWPQISTGPATSNVSGTPIPVASRDARRLNVVLATARRRGVGGVGALTAGRAVSHHAAVRGVRTPAPQSGTGAQGSTPTTSGGGGSAGSASGTATGSGSSGGSGSSQNPLVSATKTVTQTVSRVGTDVGNQITGLTGAAGGTLGTVNSPTGSAVTNTGSAVGNTVTSATSGVSTTVNNLVGH